MRTRNHYKRPFDQVHTKANIRISSGYTITLRLTEAICDGTIKVTHNGRLLSTYSAFDEPAYFVPEDAKYLQGRLSDLERR